MHGWLALLHDVFGHAEGLASEVLSGVIASVLKVSEPLRDSALRAAYGFGDFDLGVSSAMHGEQDTQLSGLNATVSRGIRWRRGRGGIEEFAGHGLEPADGETIRARRAQREGVFPCLAHDLANGDGHQAQPWCERR